MNRIASKLTLVYTLIMVVALAALLGLGKLILDKELTKGVDLLNKAEFSEIYKRMMQNGVVLPEAEFLPQVRRDAVVDASLYFLQIRRADGEIIFKSEDTGDLVLPYPPPNRHNWSHVLPGLGKLRIAIYHVGDYEVQVGSSVENLEVFSDRFLWIGSVLLLAALVVSIPTGYLLSRFAFAPIRRIRKTAERISAENLQERIPEYHGRDEVSELIHFLNAMFDRLETSFARLWQFSGNASHELKTPLALIKLHAERLLLSGELADKQKETVQQQMECVDHLNSVIQKLLFIARPEQGGVQHLKPHDIRTLVENFVEDAKVLCAEKNLQFQVIHNMDAVLLVDPPLLTQVLFNILSNAIKVSPPGTEIQLDAVCLADRWQLTITDQGSGLPAEELGKVFQPFYKFHHPGVQEEQGIGLGLAFCKKIMQMHHGDIHAHNNPQGRGLAVTLFIPLAQAKGH